MKNLKSIWTNPKSINFENNEKTDSHSLERIVQNLYREEKSRKKYSLLSIMIITLSMLTFSYVVYKTEYFFGIYQIIGVGLITLGSILMVYFAQLSKVPFKDNKYQEASVEFLTIVREKILNRKRFLIWGLSFQIVFVVIGLHLLIFSSSWHANRGEEMGVHYGFMFAFIAAGVGVIVSIYNQYYKPVLGRINEFLGD